MIPFVLTPEIKVMFFVGFFIFAIYVYALLRAIYWGHNSQREEMLNDPELRNYYGRHGMPDEIDYDENDNYNRFPKNSYKKKSNARVLREKK